MSNFYSGVSDISNIKKKDRSSTVTNSASNSSSDEDADIYTDCKEELSDTDLKSTDNHQKEVRNATKMMTSLTIANQGHGNAGQSEEDYNDLLSYYALQKS